FLLDFPEIEKIARKQANYKAKTRAWTTDLVAFLFTILLIIIILRFEGIRIEISALVAIFGLSMGWIAGWRQANKLLPVCYDEEFQEQVRKALGKNKSSD
ncbi:hypothetical protein ACFLWR_07170, partial [Chloroflexota bacterium]